MAMAMQGSMVRVKPQPDIYTLLLALAILALITAIAFMLHNLLSTYGMSFGDIFTGNISELPVMAK
jgi:hypothetical protein